ncbi:50S ribosomal protein L11 methyltransferase [Ferruginibacter yonginensis]|uniref:50S ribosomal protein L11 methyltransferase n=1 Tax=Ferruginibacter yonginensis TaxID=1310416 RepID=A0ABV8QM94_9BACT
MEYTQITFNNIELAQQEVLIAQLDAIGFDGFEEMGKTLHAYIPSTSFDKNELDVLITNHSFSYTITIIQQKNWNEKWEADFEPVDILHPITNQPFATIRAHFHTIDTSFEHNILVTPKMSFGTGHHPTTHLMVQHMATINFKNTTVIDFGTGTGILAILAEKLGATAVYAVDNDAWSIENAKENALNNGCVNGEYTLAETLPNGIVADVVLANINLNIIKAHMQTIKNATKKGTMVLFSGIMVHDEKAITDTVMAYNFTVNEVQKLGDWLLVKATA